MANGEFGGGSGVFGDPYLVEDAHDLDAVRDDMNAHYLQVSDIDLGSWGNWIPIGGSGDDPASGSSVTFDGYYNGGGYQVRNMICEHPSRDYVGLFGRASTGKLSDIGVVSQVTIGSSYVGGVSGLGGGNVNCYSTGSVTGNLYVGGISGYNGINVNCYSTCSVTGGDNVGGISGFDGGNVSCYSTGSVTGGGNVGGVSGFEARNVNCYSTGSVTGSSRVGGVSGVTGSNSNCYSSGDITGSSYVGGISGYNGGNVNCYFLGASIYRTPRSISGSFGDISGRDAYNNNCYSLDTLEFRQL